MSGGAGIWESAGDLAGLWPGWLHSANHEGHPEPAAREAVVSGSAAGAVCPWLERCALSNSPRGPECCDQGSSNRRVCCWSSTTEGSRSWRLGRQASWVLSFCECGSTTLASVPAGSQAVSKVSLDSGEAGLLVTAALPFNMAWFLCQSHATQGVPRVVAGASHPGQPSLSAPLRLL